MPKEVASVSVRWAELDDGRLMLRYRVDGNGALLVPKPARRPGRTDELWKATCLELFVYDGGGAYREFNFSPSGDWAAYGFAGYRSGRTDFDPVTPPAIACDAGQNVFVVTAYLAAEELRGAQAAALSAVLVEEKRRPSYWALHHGGLSPDFHDPACFRIRLRAAATE